MVRKAKAINLSAEERVTLERWTRARTVPHREAQRARLVLLAGDGVSNQEIAMRLGMSTPRR
ncbi:MAG: hypothetical protein HY686_06440 [Chloroflexi bacterium]|nr:hypothetical protein [Chloroflexota bacterium]